jgi:hypothetical protein
LLTNNQKDFRSIPNLRFFKTTIWQKLRFNLE